MLRLRGQKAQRALLTAGGAGAARETNEAAAQDLGQAENARKRIGEGGACAIQGTKADAYDRRASKANEATRDGPPGAVSHAVDRPGAASGTW